MKRRILKYFRGIECNIKNSDKPFWWSSVYWFFFHILNYSCVNSYLFNRIPWLLVSHITSLYSISNKDVIRAIYIKKKYIYAVIFFSQGNNLGYLNERYATDRRSHLYNCRSNIFDSRLRTRTKCYLTRVIQIELSHIV